MSLKTLLTIAGSDASGGAGVQADIKTITVHNMYAMSVITAVTAQNTTGVYGVHEIPPDVVAGQLDCVFTDIVPDAVKVGMVSSAGIIEVVAQKLRAYQAQNIVVDPVMVSTSGSRLLHDDAVEVLVKRLFPMAACLTPNIPEAEVLWGRSIKTKEDMLGAARFLSGLCPGSVLIKGGHSEGAADDLVWVRGEAIWITGKRIDNPNHHGTGCTLSSAIACHLADGLTIADSVGKAKAFVSRALRANLNLGKGSGPIQHCVG